MTMPDNADLNLHKLRTSYNLSSAKLGKKLGYSKEYIWKIERGECIGTVYFWETVQTFFNIPDADMWTLQRGHLHGKGLKKRSELKAELENKESL